MRPEGNVKATKEQKDLEGGECLETLWREWRELSSQPPYEVPLCKVRIFLIVSRLLERRIHLFPALESLKWNSRGRDYD